MSNFTKGLGACLAAALMSTGAFADPADDTLVINGEIDIVTRTEAPAHMADSLDEVMSGWLFRGAETRAMQADD
ncbi:MAG TPA: sulfur oxidation c-type cytochrome SoxA, partial [Sulfitobacter pontiacus]|nr:sulfur oxidation c-type cytochrome SoxA [Sulfitobacter pontiacus]